MENNQHRFTNKLANETSPYLLQHAHNPVNWYPWGEEALTKAKEENKPILVSIGYAACHWCHVMERESFENEDIAAFMNEYFINIKVDREERPDIDHIYMDAVQVMTGAGGWPLNVFLTPGKKPFYGGTYFPPQPAYNRSSWMQILTGVRTAFDDKRDEIEKQGDGLTNHIASQTFFSKNVNGEETAWDNELTNKAFKSLQQTFDIRDGGFGNAPKFPGTFCINFLLRYAHYSKGTTPAVSPAAVSGAKADTVAGRTALTQALLSLDKMCMGGIYDKLGGGFARYSTDREWLVPHFEKMLYDNALLIDSLSDAYKITGKEFYAEVIRQTLTFIQRELMDKDGGFYASLDADSEGVEGKFYCWDKKEIDELLKDKAALFCAYYDVTEEGNWEHKNILNQPASIEDFVKPPMPVGENTNRGGVSGVPALVGVFTNEIEEEIEKVLAEGRAILLVAREKRIRPALDDKIILSWNAMMCSAFVSAYAALGDKSFLELAERNMDFLLKAFRKSDKESFYHNYKNGKGFNFALLDDYALLIKALLDLYEANFDKQLINQANDITAYVLEHFFDEADGMFFYSSDLQTDLLLRKKEFFDGAVPSGNSVMAGNLARLAVLLDNRQYETMSRRMFLSFTNMVKSYPSSFANWLSLMADSLEGRKEVAVVGADYRSFANEINCLFIPNKIFMAAEKEDEAFPLLAGKEVSGGTLIYVCKNYSCRLPVSSMDEFRKANYI